VCGFPLGANDEFSVNRGRVNCPACLKVLNSDGFVKHDSDKNRLELLPWDALWEVGRVLTYGAKKYPQPDNWRKCQDIQRYAGALTRHFAEWRLGATTDNDSGLPILAHVATNALFLLALDCMWRAKHGGGMRNEDDQDA
jgi:hypothetical protein